MNGVSPTKQPQIINELQLLEKTVEQLGEARKALNQRLETITMEQKESSAKGISPTQPLCPMAQKIRNIRDKIRDEIHYLVDLRNKIEV